MDFFRFFFLLKNSEDKDIDTLFILAMKQAFGRGM